jgi:hypothetical protein
MFLCVLSSFIFAETTGAANAGKWKARTVLRRLPYTALRDGVLTHPTLVEGLIPLFSSVASAHNAADPTASKTYAA